MTLYRHFTSKDELVAEYLKELAGQAETLWEAARAEHPGDADRQLRYLLKRVSQFADVCSGRGCALANAAIELTEPAHPARKVIEDHKREQRQLLAALCRKAGYAKPESVADELCLLVEGARVAALGDQLSLEGNAHNSTGGRGLDVRRGLAFHAAARFSAAMSNFLIFMNASIPFAAFGPRISSNSMSGTTCHDRPYLSFSQPHIDSSPPPEVSLSQ